MTKIEKEFKLFGALFELTGLQYFTLNDISKIQPQLSLLRYLYFVIIFVFIFCFSSLYLLLDYKDMLKSFMEQKMTTFVVQNFMKFGIISVIISSTAQSFLNTEKIKCFFKNTSAVIDIMYNDFKTLTHFKSLQMVLRLLILGIVILFCFLHTFLFLKTSEDRRWLLISTIFHVVLLFVTVLKFTFYVLIINYQLEMLQEVINNLFKNQSANSLSASRSCAASITSASKKMHFPCIVSNKLISAKKIYNLLFENANIINDCMGLIILNLLVVLVISITASGYVIFVLIVDDKESWKIQGKYLVFKHFFKKKGFLYRNYLLSCTRTFYFV